jgi:hypothetical protein
MICRTYDTTEGDEKLIYKFSVKTWREGHLGVQDVPIKLILE